jgi:hypothetical protein
VHEYAVGRDVHDLCDAPTPLRGLERGIKGKDQQERGGTEGTADQPEEMEQIRLEEERNRIINLVNFRQKIILHVNEIYGERGDNLA